MQPGTRSPDGHWQWDGTQWVPAGVTGPPPPTPSIAARVAEQVADERRETAEAIAAQAQMMGVNLAQLHAARTQEAQAPQPAPPLAVPAAAAPAAGFDMFAVGRRDGSGDLEAPDLVHHTRGIGDLRASDLPGPQTLSSDGAIIADVDRSTSRLTRVIAVLMIPVAAVLAYAAFGWQDRIGQGPHLLGAPAGTLESELQGLQSLAWLCLVAAAAAVLSGALGLSGRAGPSVAMAATMLVAGVAAVTTLAWAGSLGDGSFASGQGWAVAAVGLAAGVAALLPPLIAWRALSAIDLDAPLSPATRA